MSIYLPPLARKKKVSGRHRHDTYEIFGDFQSKNERSTSYGKQFPRHNVPPAQLRATSSNRKHKPQPTNMTFLTKNPRFICEPICHARGQGDFKQTVHWWPQDENLSMEKPSPLYSTASTQRSDYKEHRNLGLYQTSYDNTCDVGTSPLIGHSDKHTIKKEKISFRHQYDSRRTPNEHERGKLHGAFIWADVPSKRQMESKDTVDQSA